MEPTPLSPDLSRIVGPRRTPTRRSAASETLVDRDALPPDVALDPDLVTMLRRHPVVAVPTGPSATSTEAWPQPRFLPHLVLFDRWCEPIVPIGRWDGATEWRAGGSPRPIRSLRRRGGRKAAQARRSPRRPDPGRGRPARHRGAVAW